MADPPIDPGTRDDTGVGPDHEVFGIIALVLVLLFVVMHRHRRHVHGHQRHEMTTA